MDVEDFPTINTVYSRHMPDPHQPVPHQPTSPATSSLDLNRRDGDQDERVTTPATPAKWSRAPALAEQAAAAHLEVDSRFVYRGDKAVQDISSSVSRLSLSTDNSKLALALLPQVSGPAAKTEVAEKKAGFLHRIGEAL